VFGVLLALTARAGADARARLAPLEADHTLSANRGEAGGEDEDELEPAPRRDELGLGAGPPGAGEPPDAEPRPRRPSRWGRLDLELVWRRALEDAAPGAPRREELWLLAIWRR
jgi:hypothetical protein